MKKIPTLYVRDPETNLKYVRDEVHPDCRWVIDGEGVPTYKWDGTAVLIDDDGWQWKRREIKPGKPVPDGFRQEGDTDPNTNKLVGWARVDLDDPADRWHREAYANTEEKPPGTYELVGPKIGHVKGGNPHKVDEHMLIRHGTDPLHGVPTQFDKLGTWLHEPTADHGPTEDGFEGVVWRHPDGRMAKIKARDFPIPDSAGQ